MLPLQVTINLKFFKQTSALQCTKLDMKIFFLTSDSDNSPSF